MNIYLAVLVVADAINILLHGLGKVLCCVYFLLRWNRRRELYTVVLFAQPQRVPGRQRHTP